MLKAGSGPMRSPMTAARMRRAAIAVVVLSAVTSLHVCPGRVGSTASTTRLRSSRRLPLTAVRLAGHPMTGNDVTERASGRDPHRAPRCGPGSGGGSGAQEVPGGADEQREFGTLRLGGGGVAGDR